jgi:hypothetical protein
MYVNLDNHDFNPHRQYAFLRYSDDEILLFLTNFANTPAKVELNIPDLAFDMAQIAEADVETEDLLWKKPYNFKVYRGQPVALEVGAYDALILPLKKIFEKH